MKFTLRQQGYVGEGSFKHRVEHTFLQNAIIYL